MHSGVSLIDNAKASVRIARDRYLKVPCSITCGGGIFTVSSRPGEYFGSAESYRPVEVLTVAAVLVVRSAQPLPAQGFVADFANLSQLAEAFLVATG